jgi:hypothetical protein
MSEQRILTPKRVLLYRIDVKSKGRVTREPPEKFPIGGDCLFSKKNRAMSGGEKGLAMERWAGEQYNGKGVETRDKNKKLAIHCK